ncbi:DDE transposase [Flammeovirga sp. MY04]|uniref:hypothetical protein n=1 Tax=Flammeovirga sp. MY04 TaxID=1191459 RepID=UPI0008061A24|nr:hypothetical protein [Flammeovirga sp. MY04]ANQ48004.1 DDE transposase [Flammeovirga sp. MY04]
MQLLIFKPEEAQPLKYYKFKNTELGKVHSCIPWEELEQLFPTTQENSGRKSWLNNKGKLALMFLKSYSGLSDEKLIERINTDWAYQMFCFRLLGDHEEIKDITLPSTIRSYLSTNIDMDKLQFILLKHWKGDIKYFNMLLMDATCYESDIRHPTDVKLLWECCYFVFEKLLFKACKDLNIKRPRNKYREQREKYLNYSKRRRKGYKLTRKRKGSLLYLLNKGLNQLQEVLNLGSVHLTEKERAKLRTIKKVRFQQQYMFDNKVERIDERIVSLAKPWLRPIVRGKETKKVEFGFKAHILQAGGICIIDHLAANAFNESTRLKQSFYKHQKIFGSATHIGADGIYATNKNRCFITSKNIITNFKKKGPRALTKEEKAIRSIIAKERSTRMEGIFGTHKRNYGLSKIKARTQANEILWITFGILTSNAVIMSKKKEKKHEKSTYGDQLQLVA